MWEVIRGIDVWTENGLVLRAMVDGKSASIYKPCKGGGYTCALPCKESTARNGLSRGKYIVR